MTVTGSDVPFEIEDALPGAALAIEASAGTGKTHALADLAARFIAETDNSASELLIVTFTRAATNELRARVRGRLIEVADRLERGPSDQVDDRLVHHLASGDVDRRLGRLRTGIAEFDAATITTIHGFAAQVRAALGVSAGLDPDARLVDESIDVIQQVCADVLAGAATTGHPAADLPTLKTLFMATIRAQGRPGIVLEPVTVDQGATGGQVLLRDLVAEAVQRLSDRQRRSGTISFTSVLTDLRAALTGPRSTAAVDSLRSRFKVALIDEFQDTDPVQWEIFRRLFADQHSGTTLVMVGDPKQAIYGFRGGDIETYLGAVHDQALVERRSMLLNWRSDAAALRALNTLFDGATFGDRSIRFAAVSAARELQHRRISDEHGPLPALSLRLAVGPGIDRTGARGSSEVAVPAAARAVERDLVDRIRALLDHGLIPAAHEASAPCRVRPRDIAVLANTNDQCASVQSALTAQGVPAVVAQGGSVLRSPAADQMRWLLHAMARPSDPRRARMYALSWFGGWSAAAVATASEADLVALQEDLRRWSDQLVDHSVADVLAQVWSVSGVVATVLATADGDRHATDLDHLAELLHAAVPAGRSNVAGLLAVLDSEPDTEDDPEVDRDVTARRIESEAEAVQVMTLWTAKGLEFPIVCVPFLWRWTGANSPVIYVDPVTGQRTFDLGNGTTWPTPTEARERKDLAAAELAGEQLRLLYVAVTRARHQTVLWWANGQNSARTALARVLFARQGGPIDNDVHLHPAVSIPPDGQIEAALAPLVESAGDTIAVDRIDDRPVPADRWVDGTRSEPATALEAARFDAPPDRLRRRWSFSAITDQAAVAAYDPYDLSLGDAGADDERPGDHGESGESGEDGRGSGAGGGRPTPTTVGDPPAGPLTRLPAGAEFGTLVHALLEQVDFTAGPGHLDQVLGDAVDDGLGRHPLDLAPVGEPAGSSDVGRRLLIDGLGSAIRSPLGPLCRQRRLADIAPGDRLNEVSFDLRLGEDGSRTTVADIGRVMAAHLDRSDLLWAWTTRLAAGAIDVRLAGHLTGSIDLVMRIADPGGGARYVVADYKTNALTTRGHVPVSADYHPSRMAEAMVEHDYPLQALLYAVALHRYLRWRLPGYRPSRHLGGAVYLFLRGMSGPGVAVSAGHPHGVFSWPIPPASVVALSDLLAGRPVSELAP